MAWSPSSARLAGGLLLLVLVVQFIAMQYVMSRVADKDAQLAAVAQRVRSEARLREDDEEAVDVMMRASEDRMRKAWQHELDLVRAGLASAKSKLGELSFEHLSARDIHDLVQKRTDDVVAKFRSDSLQSAVVDDAALKVLGATRLDSRFAAGRADVTFVVPLTSTGQRRRDIQHTLFALRRLADDAEATWWQQRSNAIFEAVFVCRDRSPPPNGESLSTPDGFDLLDFGRFRIVARLACSGPPAQSLEQAAVIGAKVGTSDLIVLWSAALRIMPESHTFLTHLDALAERVVLGAVTVAPPRNATESNNESAGVRAVMCAGVEVQRFEHAKMRVRCRFGGEPWNALNDGVSHSMALASLPIAVRWSALTAFGRSSSAPPPPAGEHNELLDLTLRAASLGAGVMTSSAAFELAGADANQLPSLEIGAHWDAFLGDLLRNRSSIVLLWDVVPACRHPLSTNAANAIALLRETSFEFEQRVLKQWCQSWMPSTEALLQLDELQYKPSDKVDVWLSYRPASKWPTFNATLGELRPAIVIGRIDGWEAEQLREVFTFADRVDEIWVPTGSARDALVNFGLPASKVALVPDSVDVDLFHRAEPFVTGSRASPALQDMLRKARTTRILAPTSASNVVLYAFLSAFDASSDVTLILWGDAVEELGALRPTIASMPHVLVISELLKKEDVVALYEEADYFMTDAYCVRLLEAMMMEVPVIAPATADMLAVATHEDAFLLPCTYDSGVCRSSLATYADALRNLSRFAVDAVERGAFGAMSAVSFAAKPVSERIAERIHNLLDKKLQRKSQK
jgi:hypothetical protein